MGKDAYSDYEEHPKFGRGPRITGLNPSRLDPGVRLHWRLSILPSIRGAIANTAVAADILKQSFCIARARTHYFDEKRKCRTCGKKFIFFAEEQKYWYEDLGFDLSANCVDCCACRKSEQRRRALLRRYEELFHVSDRSVEENLEMARLTLDLIEEGTVTTKRLETVRMLLNRVPPEQRESPEYHELRERTRNLETTPYK